MTTVERLAVLGPLGEPKVSGSSTIESLPVAENGAVQFVASAEGVTAVSR